jgi:hypothetical protein
MSLTLVITESLLREYSSISEVTQLMDRLQQISSDPGTYPPEEPDARVIDFLECIESADPNSTALSDDNTNASWGHYQFTAGELTITKVLISWKAVGNVATALRLVAATLRTCRVARYLCYQRKVVDPKSFLSDIYLSMVVDALWGFVKDIQVNVNPETSNTDSHPTPDDARLTLQVGTSVLLLCRYISDEPSRL